MTMAISHNPVHGNFCTIPSPPYTFCGTPGPSTYNPLDPPNDEIGRVFHATFTLKPATLTNIPTTIIHIHDNHGVLITSIEFISPPRICDIATAILFRIGTNHLTGIFTDNTQTAHLHPNSYIHSSDVPSSPITFCERSTPSICPYCNTPIDCLIKPPRPLAQETWSPSEGSIIAAYHEICWFLHTVPDNNSSTYFICVYPPHFNAHSSPTFYHSQQPACLSHILQLISPIPPAIVTVNRIPIHLCSDSVIADLKHLEVAVLCTPTTTSHHQPLPSHSIVTFFPFSPIPFITRSHTLHLQPQDTITDLLHALVISFWLHPDQSLLLITDNSQIPTPLHTLSDTLAHMPLHLITSSHLGSHLTLTQTHHHHNSHLTHARTAD